MDYSRKDKDGHATRTQATNYNAFKTRKGRTVYDGGGVLPDVELENTKLSNIAESLQKNNGIFDFATAYYYKNQNLGNTIPTITDTDFEDFKQFLKTNKYNFDTETEKALLKTLDAAKKENLDNNITAAYNQLFEAVQKSEESQMDKAKTEINKLLLDEIIKRFQYKEGLYQFYTSNSAEIKVAIEILENTSKYNKILKK